MTAFLNNHLDRKLYIKQPKDYYKKNPDNVWFIN